MAMATPAVGQTSADERLDAAIAADEFGSITSVIVRQHGELVYERHFDEAAPETLRNTRSATKTITGILLGIAIADGAISSLDEPVLSFFPDRQVANPDPRKDAMRLRDLLTMTGPLECNDFNSFSRGNEERMYLVEDWTQFFLDLPIAAVPPWEPPAGDRPYGTVFSYCTAGVFVLGHVIEQATGKELEDYAQERLFGPLGITEARWPFSALGIAQGGGGLELSTSSLAAIGQLYLDEGRFEGTSILPAPFVQQSVEPATRARDGVDYGFLWWLHDLPVGESSERMWMMSGAGGNKVAVVPDRDAVIVVTSTNFGRRDAHSLSEQLIADYLLPLLTD